MTKWQICTHTQYFFFPLKRAIPHFLCVQFSRSVMSDCEPRDRRTPGLPVHHQLLELAQTHVHWVRDAIQPSHPLPSPSPAFNISQHQGLFWWVSSSHQVAKVLEFQLQHQSFQWIFRTDSFRMDWLDLLAVQGTLKKSSLTPQFKSINSSVLSFLYSELSFLFSSYVTLCYFIHLPV